MKKIKDIEDYDIYKLSNRYDGASCTCLRKHGKEKQIKKVNDVFDALLNICFFDAPDGYYIKENKIIIFEHFEFDSSINKRKGSEYRRESNIIDGEIEKWSKSNEGVIVFENKALSSTEYLTNNFNNQLSSHCKKFENYKKNLIDNGVANSSMSFELCILAENVDPNGISQIDDVVWKDLKIWDIKECVQNIKSNYFNYLIIFSKSNGEKEMEFRFKEDFADMKENKLKKATDIRLFAPKWNTIAGNYFIPNKK